MEDAWKSWVASSRTTWPRWAFAWKKRLETSAPWSGSTKCVSTRPVSSRSATNISTTSRKTSSSSKTTTNEPKSALRSVPAWVFPWNSPFFAVSGWVETWSSADLSPAALWRPSPCTRWAFPRVWAGQWRYMRALWKSLWAVGPM